MDYRREDDLTDEIIDLYEASFSDIEKIPYDNIRRTFGKGGELISYRDGGRFVGFTFQFMNGGKVFLVYFATVPELRSKGYGSKIIGMLRRIYPDVTMFLPMESLDPAADDIGMRKRRYGFYLRNGCTDPGYTVISDDYPFSLLFISGMVPEKEAADTVALYEDIHNGRL